MGRNDKCRYQRNCAFSDKKRKRAAWNKRKDKTMNLDTQANLAQSDNGSIEWLEEYECRNGVFYMNKMIKNLRLVEIMIATGRKVQVKKMKAPTVLRRSCPLDIAVVLHHSCFFPQSSTASFRPSEKASPEYLCYKEVNQNNSKRSNQLGEI